MADRLGTFRTAGHGGEVGFHSGGQGEHVHRFGAVQRPFRHGVGVSQARGAGFGFHRGDGLGEGRRPAGGARG